MNKRNLNGSGSSVLNESRNAGTYAERIEKALIIAVLTTLKRQAF
jgi:hypothetical protein